MHYAVVRNDPSFAVLGLSLLIFCFLRRGLPDIHIIGRVELNLVRYLNDNWTLMVTQVLQT
jgi:hypothetical protein